MHNKQRQRTPKSGARCFERYTFFEVQLPKIEIAKGWRSIEAFFEIIARIVGLIIVYAIFEFIGKKLIGDDFQKDILLSLVVLPAIYVLKDSYKILEAFFVKIEAADNSVTVTAGILTVRKDQLGFKSVENIEQVTTIIGRIVGYSTIYLYAYGSWVKIPFVKNADALKDWLDKRITKQSSTD